MLLITATLIMLISSVLSLAHEICHRLLPMFALAQNMKPLNTNVSFLARNLLEFNTGLVLFQYSWF